MERGLKRNKRKLMTLIYKGQKYVQNKAAAKKQHNELTQRKSLHKLKLITNNKKDQLINCPRF